MILVEGIDKCGKGVVCSALRALMPGWVYRHQIKPPVKPFSYFGWMLENARPQTILDRAHWSQIAYGYAYRDEVHLTPHEWRMIELMLLTYGTQVIYLHDSEERMRERWTPDEPDFAQVPALVDLYDSLLRPGRMYSSHLWCERYKLPQLINLTDGKPTQTLRQIVERQVTIAKAISYLPPARIGWGNTSPQFVILGEAASITDTKDDLPGGPFDRGPSSEWLWKAIDAIYLRWWLGYITNVNVFASAYDLEVTIANLNPSRVICLGTQARSAMRDVAGPWQVYHLTHPQYARRFKHGEFHDWAGQLKQALEPYCDKQAPPLI